MAADTRDRILDALEKLLLVSGVAQVTLEGVAAEAGVSKGGLLYHFPSKEALLAVKSKCVVCEDGHCAISSFRLSVQQR
ncbi:hypothetical protein rerp_33190 [Rhodococcus erythropolis]|nr:hypothetical protein rerp_33190 [Rhodococcus erythropolis]